MMEIAHRWRTLMSPASQVVRLESLKIQSKNTTWTNSNWNWLLRISFLSQVKVEKKFSTLEVEVPQELFFLLSCNKSFQIQKQSNIVNFNSIVIVIQFFIGSPPFFRLFFFFSTEKTHKRAPKKPKKWIIKTKTTMTMTMKTLTLITLTTTTMITILITLNHPSTIHWRI